MPPSTGTPLRPTTRRRTLSPSSARSAAAPATAAVNPLRLPRRARGLTGRACAPLRERAYDAWLQPRRRSVAALLRLAVAGGWLLDAALDAALDDPAPNTALYRLLDEALSGLPIWMEGTARRSVLDATRMPNWAPFATLTLLKSEAECHLFLALEHLWPHTFHLDDLPPALAVAVAQTLSLIGTHLTECVLARDLAEGWADEAAAAYHEIKALGHTDPADRWAAVCDNAAWSDWFGWNDSDEFEGWWAQQSAFDEPQAIWLRRWHARGRPPEDRIVLRRLMRRLWRWRRFQGLTSLPWFRWLRRAILTLRWAMRRWSQPPRQALVVETDTEPLAYGQPLGFNEAWEPALLDESFEYLASNSDGCGWALRADPDTPALYETLWAFAIGQGLLIGACQADAWAQGLLFE